VILLLLSANQFATSLTAHSSLERSPFYGKQLKWSLSQKLVLQSPLFETYFPHIDTQQNCGVACGPLGTACAIQSHRPLSFWSNQRLIHLPRADRPCKHMAPGIWQPSVNQNVILRLQQSIWSRRSCDGSGKNVSAWCWPRNNGMHSFLSNRQQRAKVGGCCLNGSLHEEWCHKDPGFDHWCSSY
jgi:hypothetical protein